MKCFTKRRLVRAPATPASIAGRIAVLAMAVLFAGACSDSTGPEGLETLTVAPATETVAVTETVQLSAAATRAGSSVTNLEGETWSVSGGGTISENGLFTAGTTPGTSTVTVTCGGLTSTAVITVTSGPLATITVTPDPATLEIGATQQFLAMGLDAQGNEVDITPTWSATSGGTIDAGTGLFTAGSTTGTFDDAVIATDGSISGNATVIVTPGPLATITVTPDPVTLQSGTQQQFTAVGRDADGNVVPITPVWSVTAGGGTINSGSGLFTAGTTAGTFNNTVRATEGSLFGTATVTVTSVPPPVPSSSFSVLASAAVSCTDGSINGDVGTFQASPTGSITLSNCPITGGTPQVGTAASIQAYNDFVSAYNTIETAACDAVLTGTLAGQILAPGVYCFDAAASLTGTLTLNGPATGEWLFKVGTSGVGALTGTNFDVVMAGSAAACNVTWWVQDGATMTDSDLMGNILAGAGVTLTRGTLTGDAWSQADVTITGTDVSGC